MSASTTARQTTRGALRRAGLALICGGAVVAVQGTLAQLVRSSTTVSEDASSFPWSPGAFTVMCAVLAWAYAIVAVGLAALRRDGALGPRPGARRGLAVTIAGAALVACAELGSIPFAEDATDDAGPAALGGVFGLGTLLMGVGLVVAGIAARRAGRWSGWARTAPLAAGIWTVCLTGIAATDLLAAGVALQGALLLAIGLGMTADRKRDG